MLRENDGGNLANGILEKGVLEEGVLEEGMLENPLPCYIGT